MDSAVAAILLMKSTFPTERVELVPDQHPSNYTMHSMHRGVPVNAFRGTCRYVVIREPDQRAALAVPVVAGRDSEKFHVLWNPCCRPEVLAEQA